MGKIIFILCCLIVLAILQDVKSGCAHSLPPLNKVGFSVIYFYDRFQEIDMENVQNL